MSACTRWRSDDAPQRLTLRIAPPHKWEPQAAQRHAGQEAARTGARKPKPCPQSLAVSKAATRSCGGQSLAALASGGQRNHRDTGKSCRQARRRGWPERGQTSFGGSLVAWPGFSNVPGAADHHGPRLGGALAHLQRSEHAAVCEAATTLLWQQTKLARGADNILRIQPRPASVGESGQARPGLRLQ
jgi:hypothetical protein